MIYIYKIDFILQIKKNEVIFLIWIKYVAKSIRKKMVHIALNINTCKTKSAYTNIGKILTC